MGDGKQQLRFAAAALVAGCAWGYLRNRERSNRVLLALLQGIEWFVAYGGAAALIEGLRSVLDRDDEEEPPERVTHIRQIVAERGAASTGTEG
jgi:hypothetical protein